MHAIAVGNINIAVDIQPHEFARGGFLAPDQCIATNEIISFRFEWYSKANPRFKGICLITEIIARENLPRLNADHIQGFQPHRFQPMVATCCPNRIEYRLGMFRVAKNLIPQLASVASA